MRHFILITLFSLVVNCGQAQLLMPRHYDEDSLRTVLKGKPDDATQVKVLDNGNRIPDIIKEKVFQPFFTTKPAGQGTGLGLSLSYDIVQAHGGTLTLNSNVGAGSHFIVHMPAIK